MMLVAETLQSRMRLLEGKPPYYTERPAGFAVHPSEVYAVAYDALMRGEARGLRGLKDLAADELRHRLGRDDKGRVRWHKTYTDMVRQAIKDYYR